MANGLTDIPFRQRFGMAILDPGFFGRQAAGQQRAGLQREKIRIAALQAALESLPIDNPNRPELEASLGQLTGEPTIGMAFRPKPAEEGFTLGTTQGRFELDPAGQPQLVAAGPRFTPEESGGGDPRFGRSQSGLAMDIMVRARNKQRQGVPLTPENRDELAFARSILTAPRIIQGPGGSLIQAEPLGVPAQFESLFDEGGEGLGVTRGGQPIEKVSRQVRTGQFELTELKGEKSKIRAATAAVIDQANDIADLIVEGRQEVGGIAGVAGTAKAIGGGLMRQAGVPVTGRAKRLRRKLETIKLLAAPGVLQEAAKSLSDKDRERLDEIVGTVNVLTDEQDIEEAIEDLVGLMLKMVEIEDAAGETP